MKGTAIKAGSRRLPQGEMITSIQNLLNIVRGPDQGVVQGKIGERGQCKGMSICMV